MSDKRGTGGSNPGPSASRKFYQLPTNTDNLTSTDSPETNKHNLLQYIEDNVIGKNKVFSGPYGLRKALYCDYIASGRSLKFLEDYIEEQVLPDYGNTHTTTTVTSLQTTLFRHEARDIIRNAVNASEHDAVIFTGSGCTGAVHKLIHALHLQSPPIVFVGPYEHHSTLLPWREVGSEVTRIRETADGLVDVEHLEQQLQTYRDQGHTRQLIGCFAAASNITGILTDVDSVTSVLHQYGALALWDYATAAPYLDIDMNPVSVGGKPGLCHKDAVFISAHKFVGGVQTPGVLVVKKKLLLNPVPSNCGGGAVFFVRREGHRYLQEAEMREEGGTPAIVESIRAGLVFQLKEAVGSKVIMEREHELCRQALSSWKDVDNLVILGNTDVPRLPVFSFMVKHPATGLFLHYNYVCTLLNDLFGVQARGGCACAGPYAEDLLGISEDLAQTIEEVLVEDSRLDRVHLRRYREYSEKEILRPGFARLALPFFLSAEPIQFVLEAVKMVAEHGWKLLPQYNFNPETGEWRHRQHQVFKDRKWLGHVSYRTGHMTWQQPVFQEKGPLPQDYQDCLDQAKLQFQQAHRTRVHIADQTMLFGAEVSDLRWFLLPSEALAWLQKPQQAATTITPKSPFHPVTYPRKDIVNRNPFVASKGEGLKVTSRMKDAGESLEFREGMTAALLEGYGDGSCDKDSAVTVGPVHSTDKDSAVTRKGPVHSTDKDSAVTRKGPVHSTDTDKDSEVTRKGPVHSSDKDSAVRQDGHVHSTDKDSAVRQDGHVHSSDQDSAVRQDGHVHSSDKDSSVRQDGPVHSTPAGTGAGDNVCKRLPKVTAVEGPKTGHKWHAPPKEIFKPTIQALEEYSMISDGDRVLVCLSGGKDSLSLLHAMHQYQFYSKKKGVSFELGAVTVDPQTSSYDPSPLKGYLAQLGVPYFYEEQCIMESAQSLPYECASICSFCSRMKRGRIYHCARREGYNVLALGQHLDDLAESFLMSMFHNGILRTMKACYAVQQGDLRVVRPFVYVREKDLRNFAQHKHLPVISENCPACFEAPKERHRMKQLLASQEVVHPRLFHSLLSAIKPVMSISRTGVNVKQLLSQQHGEYDDDALAEEGDIDQL